MSEDWKAITGLTNPLQRHSKGDMGSLMLVARHFCYGVDIERAASAAALSKKSVRSLYFQMRSRLMKKQFAKWHHANRKLLFITSPDMEKAIRLAFYDTLSRCYFNANCFRNFRDGKRKSRLCRKCSLPDQLGGSDSVTAAIDFIDAVRSFYARLKIGTESDLPPIEIFKQRAIHTATIAAAAGATKMMPSGGYDYTDRNPLSFRTLLETLIAELAESPLDSRYDT